MGATIRLGEATLTVEAVRRQSIQTVRITSPVSLVRERRPLDRSSTRSRTREPAMPTRRRLRTPAVSSAHDDPMPTYTDEGIVLRRIDYGESDRILTVLTLEHGKIGVIARGVRRSQSRLASRTDLFTRSRMQLARGRGELDVLTQAEFVTATPVRSDARRAACASLCAELTDRVLESHHADPEIYALVAAALNACADPSAIRAPRSSGSPAGWWTVWATRHSCTTVRL